MVDSKGLVVASRAGLAEHKVPFAHDHPSVDDFLGAVRTLKPTAIIGVGAMPGMFTREVIAEMSRLNERPIVFALSNPTSKAECTAAQAYEWSAGRALFASGSPFDPVDFGGQHFVPRQGNNSYIFPGVGLGVIASRSSRITDDMFMAAARALAANVQDSDLAQGSLYPPLREVREVSAHIAVAVAEIAFRDGLAEIDRPDDLPAYIRKQMFNPRYPIYAV
jgi:malate dehydrogenase (oxaloacetate-decarboxylating)(NADP+)